MTTVTVVRLRCDWRGCKASIPADDAADRGWSRIRLKGGDHVLDRCPLHTPKRPKEDRG